ncbi:response regulator transcription factor [Clostridium botulinum]|uniref:Stage 0 sporulation protein A homolog n=1 Tax=Clostridium botulinum TaxID=1491 RepID=A0A9Q1UXC5_CLOBO|nr:response regulator transcription factor [Clostridium botulinum]AEB77543.1 Two component transcriptional (response) regulator [Clostridium botulinum BKT015925]KEH95941.1 Two component transcriptional regulator [Clostridium botulinum C/D str. Sp77]KEH96810.1 chemotaxis protein CheY [Clostridium botulinum D str. 16868]KLU74537.1 chemotaxis protein CheY [Clostridium botulinum V891]KOA73040.1 chemotaxis protein CheY [Clostridium botulinum]
MKNKILVIDDNEDICTTIKSYLENYDFNVKTVTSCRNALNILNEKFDLIILDIMMPEMDGIEFCSIIRKKVSCPILFVSAKILEEDKLQAFAIGGDDYITKPFSLKELKARIESHLRREERIKSKEVYILSSGNIILDAVAHDILCKGEKLKLTNKEYNMVKFLMLNKNIVFSKEKLLDNVWGMDSESYLETVTESIKNIRKKIKNIDKDNSYISTIYGQGYKWEVKHEK